MEFDLYIKDSLVEKIDPMLDRYHTFKGSRVRETASGRVGTIIGKNRYEGLMRDKYEMDTYELDETNDVLIEFEGGDFIRERPSRFINRFTFLNDSIRNDLLSICRPSNGIVDSAIERAKAVEAIKSRK